MISRPSNNTVFLFHVSQKFIYLYIIPCVQLLMPSKLIKILSLCHKNESRCPKDLLRLITVVFTGR